MTVGGWRFPWITNWAVNLLSLLGSDCLYPCGQLDHCEEGTEIMNFLKLSLLSLSFFHSLQFLLKQIQKQKQLHLPIPLRMIKEMVQKLDYWAHFQGRNAPAQWNHRQRKTLVVPLSLMPPSFWALRRPTHLIRTTWSGGRGRMAGCPSMPILWSIER